MERYELKHDDPFELSLRRQPGATAVIVGNGDIVAVVRPDRPAERAPGAPVDIAVIEARHSRFPVMRVHSATALVRDMREMDDH